MDTVTFDGIELTDYCTVLVRRGVSSHDVRTESVPGRDGVVVTGADYAPPELSLVFVLGPTCDAPSKVREIASLLDVREPRKLELGEDGGLYCMAMPYGSKSWRRLPHSSSLEVPFIVADAAMYGRERSVTVPSGGSVEFSVGGTYPTRPIIEASAAVRNSTSGLWGLTLDNASAIRLALGSNTARQVSVDCDERTVTIASLAGIPTLASSWLELSPGSHVLQMDQGTGAATVTWRERWLA